MIEEKTEEKTTGLSILSPFQHQEEELKKLATDYTNLVVTEENLKQAEEARLKLWRIRVKEIAKTLKDNLEKIKTFKTDQEEKAEKLCKIIQPVEEDLERRISKVKTEKERREREEREKEQKRIAEHRTKINEVTKLSVKINTMEMEQLALLDIGWIGTYDAQEFQPEFNNAKNVLIQAKTNRMELLQLRKAEAERKAKEEEEKAGAKKYDDDFKQLTEMLTSVNLTEDLKKVEIFLEIGMNTQPYVYGPHAAQAEGVLAALKMLAETRREFLIKRAAEAVTIAPKKTPQVSEEIPKGVPTYRVFTPAPDGETEYAMAADEKQPLPQIEDKPTTISGHVPNREAFGTPSQTEILAYPVTPNDATEPPLMANHFGDIHEPAPVVKEETSPMLNDFNVFRFENYTIALSKNMPEKAAKSILSYSDHLLKTK